MAFLWIFLILFQAHASISLKFMTHPEGNLNMEQKIKKHGYPLEIHEVITEDNYILTIHRIPHGRHPPGNGTRSPVLLLHGMGAQPEYFLVLGRNSLVYYLADRGFDVWILNSRGSRFSQKHKYLDSKDRNYWKFSFHEIGVYDIPANVDYIVNKTNQKVFIIGHSQGNTCYFIMVAERPEYNELVKISAVYAPSFLLKYMDYPLAVMFSYLVDLFELLYEFLGMGMLFPVSNSTSFLVKVMCSETTYFSQLCTHILSVVGSHESKITTKETAALLFTIPPSSIAARQLFHYMQGVKSGIFRQYDFGETENLRRYKTLTPPEYNVSKAVAPVAIFYAEKDEFTSIRGALEITKMLPNVIFSYKVPYKYFNHIDFLFGSNASDLVYKKTVKTFKNFDSEQLKRRKKKLL